MEVSLTCYQQINPQLFCFVNLFYLCMLSIILYGNYMGTITQVVWWGNSKVGDHVVKVFRCNSII